MLYLCRQLSDEADGDADGAPCHALPQLVAELVCEMSKRESGHELIYEHAFDILVGYVGGNRGSRH